MIEVIKGIVLPGNGDVGQVVLTCVAAFGVYKLVLCVCDGIARLGRR